ncbi:MAG: hypothetical protein HZB51_29115 [Chloroflexi bacterium]|nr:hypothetical protein [Chloroflexota bacterium]
MPLQIKLPIIFLVLVAISFVAACEPVTVVPTMTPLPATATLTRTPEPSPTHTPVVVAFPTAAPTPIASPTVNAPPTQRAPTGLTVVQLVSPVTNAQISVNQTYTVVIYAAAENGVARIELTDDGTPVKVDNPQSPVQVFSALAAWTPNQIGQHTLRAVAYDANNRPSLPDETTVAVTTDARKPTSIIVYPIGIPQIEFGSALPIYGVATDDVGVTQVDLWVDSQLYAYLNSTNANGQSAFPFVFSWLALSPGNHTFFVRSHDNQDQTTDSAALKILVVDTQTPSVSVAFDRTNAPVGESITITVAALDVAGIQRVDLLSGKEVFSSIPSGNAARQTSLVAQIVWQNPNPGDYSIVARAYNANGVTKDSAPQVVSILRAGQNTPTTVPTVTPTRTRARPTLTPRSQPPAAPKAEITAPTNQFSQPLPLRVAFSGQASAELERIELWASLPGQASPHIVCTIDSKASTQKSGQCEWTPPAAGVYTLFAQAIDIYHQTGRSASITGYVGVPLLPTPTPTPVNFSGRYTAATSQGLMTANLRQTGTAMRGDFRMAGVEATGRITTGSIKAERLTFSVDFSSPITATPTPMTTVTATATLAATPSVLETPTTPLTMEFDCATDVTAGTLSCTYRDSRGRTGAAFFRRETTP